MWLLLGCDNPYTWTPIPCPGWDELVVTDPEGVATAEELEDADATLAAFAGWVATDVCVGEVRFVVEANEEHPSVAGWFRAREDLVVVETGTDVSRVVTHELCHAWDDVAGFSTTYADLLPPLWLGYDAELYPTEEERSAEAFAQYCEGGPSPRALSIAAEEACGVGDALAAITRDEVFPGYEEEIPIEVGGSVTLVPLEVPSLGDVTWVDLAQADGGVALLYDSGLAILDLETLVWSEPVAVHLRSAALAATVGGAHAVVTDDVTLLELVQGDLVDPGMTWLPELLDETIVGTTLTLDPDRAVWQVWGDGEPLQHRERAGGEATPVPGDEGLVLSPTTTMLPEGQLVWHSASLAPSPVAYALADGVAPAAVPPGVVPVATFPGGEVLATGGSWYETAWLVRSADGEWRYPQGNCEEFQGGYSYAAGGGRVVSLGWDGGLTLDEVELD